ncbi:protein prenylyltransferase [Durotheca rogersii]|uniref:protein prenylyltransferase n=1 Tax=Durotheca rogersii TaxID=419775 RepID=UPI00221F53AC|nr:protein prenylyltransferase [Durotheca rogersii]KAI5862361.1 protein prenylyltransferase [Durotheca rogersii]
MSRSLDKGILASLEAENPKPAYNDISSLLTGMSEGELLEIELLGKSHPLQPGINYLRDGTAVAIPKLRLFQAFFVARQMLDDYRNKDNLVGSYEAQAATTVVLLTDPEHLTAANTRKRLLASSILEAGSPDVGALLRREKQFVDSLLTSRLYRHAKSPTLWSHRRWLLRQFAAHGVVVDPRHDIKNIIMVAGTRHPRNYPAWHHARFLLGCHPQFAAPVATDVKEFCLRNHADISSWSFLGSVIGAIGSRETRCQMGSSFLTEILQITDSLRWKNESVWVFLRSVATAEFVSEGQFESILAVNKRLASVTPKDDDQWRILDSARRWCDANRILGESTGS